MKTALDAYILAQEQAKKATDESTEAMMRQNSQALRKAIQESSKAYADAMKELNELTVSSGWDRLGNPSEIEQQQEIVDGIRRNMQEIFNEALGEVSFDEGYKAMVETPELFSSQDLRNLDKYTASLGAAEYELESLKEEAAGLKTTIDDVRMSALQLYEDGTMGLSEIGGISKDLAEWVLEADKAYQDGLASAAAYGAITEENAAASRAYITQLSEELLAVEEGSMEYVTLKTTIEELTKAYNELAKATGKPLIGVPSMPSQKPSSGSSGSGSASGSQPSGDRSIADVWADLAKGFDDNSKKAEVFGESFDEIGGNISLVEGAINELIEDFDLDPASQDVQYLKDALAGLQEQADSSQEALKRMGEELLAWSESAATSFAQSIGSGISQLVTDFMTIDEQVEALNEELGDAQAEQIERNEALAEAEEEYRLALLEGNQSEIEAALESLQAAEDSKEAQDEKVASLKDEIKATEDGTKAWESFGKSALSALADVLEGLGAQLAAQAVAQAIAFNWVNAAIAAAGSIAAYAAAGAIRGLAGSYAEGGIVPQVAGVPSTGDQHIARVNPGELILNEAQQGNIASLLTAQQAIIDSRKADTAGDARSIVIEIDGDIYGLDSEEVGRAIYRNIRSLQEEGRIGRWR